MGRAQLRNMVKRFFELPIARFLVFLHISPNTITFAGLILAVLVAYLLSQGCFVLGGLVLLCASLLDMLDGSVARLSNSASKKGAFLDSTSDRIAEAVVLFGLLVYYADLNESQAILLIFLALILSFLVSYIRARAEGLGVEGTPGLFTRPERVLVLVLGLLSGWVIAALWIIISLSVLTVAQRLIYSLRQMR
jgi:CDP-diacylglycerol--glycerol-3-phosphate 3-phosphatidyltransferase